MYLEKVEENCRMALSGKRGRGEFSKFKCFGEEDGEEEDDLRGFRKELMQRVIFSLSFLFPLDSCLLSSFGL